MRSPAPDVKPLRGDVTVETCGTHDSPSLCCLICFFAGCCSLFARCHLLRFLRVAISFAFCALPSPANEPLTHRNVILVYQNIIIIYHDSNITVGARSLSSPDALPALSRSERTCASVYELVSLHSGTSRFSLSLSLSLSFFLSFFLFFSLALSLSLSLSLSFFLFFSLSLSLFLSFFLFLSLPLSLPPSPQQRHIAFLRPRRPLKGGREREEPPGPERERERALLGKKHPGLWLDESLQKSPTSPFRIFRAPVRPGKAES